MVKEIINEDDKKIIAKTVLDDLTEWFGIPEYTSNYIDRSSYMPFLAFVIGDNPVGFVSLNKTSNYTCEIYCMGVLKKYHHKGYGRQLYFELEKLAKSLGYRFIQVKTVETGRYDEYDRTNLFYKSVGFFEFEVFPTLWDDCNPCQIYIKHI